MNTMLHSVAVLLTLLSVVICRHVPELGGGRIVGGHDADVLDYPYQVSLVLEGFGHDCGGSIVSETFIITAGHCTAGSDTSDWQIRVNSSTKENGGILVDIKTINVHPNFGKDIAHDYDISILELKKPLVLGPGVQPVPLPEASETLAEGTEISTSGWGDVEENQGGGSDQLQAVETHSIPNGKCQQYYDVIEDVITDRMICAGDPETGGKDACQGDSGGPLVANGKLFGVVSWGEGCAEKGFPGVYTNVADVEIRAYVKEITGL